MTIPVQLGKDSYDIILDRGVLHHAGELLNLNRKVLVVTDSGVPEEYAKTVMNQCREPVLVCVPAGEDSKSIAVFEQLCRKMLDCGFSRRDCVVAVGGGVVGDLAGFAAASYMRGIDFYNIPTTLLSQVDSSIGGKTGVNLGAIKNIVGAFYQPKRVLIDPEVLKTLDPRTFAEGLAEAVKMALTSDKALFELIERENVEENIDEIIKRSLLIKKSIVEQDEKESGLRKMLNFGHTIGHAIESEKGLGGLLHGECVGLGMLPMCGEQLRPRLLKVLEKLGLPTKVQCSREAIYESVRHDKKAFGDSITITCVDEPGKGYLVTIPMEEMKKYIERAFL